MPKFLQPAFFDNFGFIGFIFIGIITVFLLLNIPIPLWMKIVLLVIAILGCLVDGYIIETVENPPYNFLKTPEKD